MIETVFNIVKLSDLTQKLRYSPGLKILVSILEMSKYRQFSRSRFAKNESRNTYNIILFRYKFYLHFIFINSQFLTRYVLHLAVIILFDCNKQLANHCYLRKQDPVLLGLTQYIGNFLPHFGAVCTFGLQASLRQNVSKSERWPWIRLTIALTSSYQCVKAIEPPVKRKCSCFSVPQGNILGPALFTIYITYFLLSKFDFLKSENVKLYDSIVGLLELPNQAMYRSIMKIL